MEAQDFSSLICPFSATLHGEKAALALRLVRLSVFVPPRFSDRPPVRRDARCAAATERVKREMATAERSYERMINPIDLVEQLATAHDWAVDRSSDEELTLIVAGTWTDYHVSLNWREDLEALHLACAFDFRVPSNRLNEMYRLVAQINEQLWLGHFDLWTQDGLVMFRHALLLNGAVATTRQCEALLRAALEGCERYYQAFQFVVWAGKESREALVSTMFETEGQA
jgi:hypothetical protein